MVEEAREDRHEFVNYDAANTNNCHSNPSSPDREPSFSPSFDFTGIANKSISFILDGSHGVLQWTSPCLTQVLTKPKIQARKAMQS
jgi:hypothetical protein